ncbi:FtsW/RodA/SpoVE family cell cycle protein [Marinivivus vitaminiproducens]|uniref:FtsW/RodA/SpoVE family cell cycle protein n=1 Tax=Marinivivus vitaminiproducens TaxID=3035935 RepID=UPI0027A3EF39|nr:FtsW/RodA/SpoVE family cell cycle protein [Geminicoccaceae bacterium SCSIO 64248]
MTPFARTDRSFLAVWWWTVDRTLLGAIGVLAAVGLILIFAASPAVAERNGLPPLYFVVKHLTMLGPAALILVLTSMLSHRGVLTVGRCLLVLGLVGLIATAFVGPEIKGARRWLVVAGFGIQAGEFLKPALAICTAAWLAGAPGLRGAPWPLAVVGGTAVLLAMQPDVGMALTVTAILGIQLFLAGLPWFLLLGVAAVAGIGAWQAYAFWPHVAQRIDAFLNPDTIPYQVRWALAAITGGGLLGRGPGEGAAKYYLPDAHSDFIFAVAVEEFGLIAALALVGLIGFVLIRTILRAREATERFVVLAIAGLIGTYGLQAFINIGVNLRILPTKGMTLPLVSYGGSSLCATALTLGFVLALLRRPQEIEVTLRSSEHREALA